MKDDAGLEARLRAKAAEYKDLAARLGRLGEAGPQIAAIAEQRQKAEAALAVGDFEAADERLAEIEALALAEAAELPSQFHSRLSSAAETRAVRAAAARLRLDYLAAAEHFGEAARIAAPLGDGSAWRFALDEVSAIYDHGRERGDNEALRLAIERCRTILQRSPRADWPDDWATTQNNLGTVLWTLGQRESGTARLEEAVEAFRAALEERTRERVPLQLAQSQHNLSRALEALADRRGSQEELQEALGCMRFAAEVYREGGVDYWLPLAEASIARMEEKLAQRTAVAGEPSNTEP